MKKLILFIALISQFQNASAQWVTMKNLPVTSLNKIGFSSPDSGWVASNNSFGEIFRTTDAGKTWTTVPLFQSGAFIYNIYFKSNEGYISGNSTLKTVDGGTTWSTFNLPNTNTSVVFNSLQFTQNNYMGVIDGTTYKFNKNESSIRKTNLNLSKAFYCDTLIGYSINGVTIRKTINGGISWSALGNMPREPYNNLYFTSPTTGFAIGQNGFIIYTNDGGLSWKVISKDINNFNYYDITFTTSKVGYICGDQGTILKTTNGGLSWKPMKSGTFEDLYALNFPDSTRGYCVGTNGIVLRLIEDTSVPQITAISFENAKLCAGASYTLAYNVNKKFKGDNIFTAFLSDATGDYSKAIAIGNSKSDTSGIIKITIPANTPRNIGYRIRIESSAPQGISSSTENFLEIQPSVTPAITIITGVNSICEGNAIKLTSNSVNAGSSPIINWFEKNKLIGTRATITYTPRVNDTINVSLQSNITCATKDSVLSALVIFKSNSNSIFPITITNQLVTLQSKILSGLRVDVALNRNTICAGTTVSFNTFIVNGGNKPQVLWYNNKSIVGMGQKFSFVPTINDKIFAVLKNNLECIINDSSISNPTNFVDVLPLQQILEDRFVKIITPVKPKISKDLNQLSSSAASGNQWYQGNLLIPNAVNPTYTAVVSDTYKVEVNDGICPSIFSEPTVVELLITSVDISAVSSGLKVYPNPVIDILNIECDLELEKFVIYQMHGQKLWEQNALLPVQVAKLASGMYLLEVWDKKGNRGVIKFVKR